MSNMTPSMTDDQVNKLVEQFRAYAIKHAKDYTSEASQVALGTKGLVEKMFVPFRERVEAVSNMIIRHVTVDLGLTGQQALKATGRVRYTTDSVVSAMPRPTVTEASVYFFNIGRDVSCADLYKEYELRGLEPVDPFTLAAVNKADPAFADSHPNATQWTDVNDKFCYEAFTRWGDERGVRVYQFVGDWLGEWWFGGVRKSTQT